MPHKHRRDKAKRDEDAYELPPSTIAQPLPVVPPQPQDFSSKKPKSRKQRKYGNVNASGTSNFPDDDTPKAFARLMQFQAKGRYPSGLDDGTRKSKNGSKKRKRGDDDESEHQGGSSNGAGKQSRNDAAAHNPDNTGEVTSSHAHPQILPGEHMADFAARVDAAIPVSGLIRKGRRGRDPAGLKTAQTRTEKKMQKLQQQWRDEERKIQERRREELEDAEARAEEDMLDWAHGDGGSSLFFERGVDGTTKKKTKQSTRKKRKKGGKKGGQDALFSDEDEDDDEGKVTKARRRPLHDVVQEPPRLTVVPTAKFKVKHGAAVDVVNVPRAAGSLRKREELGVARKDVLQAYRALHGRSG